jgi:hypothetical protein
LPLLLLLVGLPPRGLLLPLLAPDLGLLLPLLQLLPPPPAAAAATGMSLVGAMAGCSNLGIVLPLLLLLLHPLLLPLRAAWPALQVLLLAPPPPPPLLLLLLTVLPPGGLGALLGLDPGGSAAAAAAAADKDASTASDMPGVSSCSAPPTKVATLPLLLVVPLLPMPLLWLTMLLFLLPSTSTG